MTAILFRPQYDDNESVKPMTNLFTLSTAIHFMQNQISNDLLMILK